MTDVSECVGCVTGADVGLTEYAGSVVHADPNCPVHGESSRPGHARDVADQMKEFL